MRHLRRVVHALILNVRDLPDRLAIQRLRTLQEKKGAQAKAARRDIAVLLEKGKLETARIKVENSAWHELMLLISPADT